MNLLSGSWYGCTRTTRRIYRYTGAHNGGVFRLAQDTFVLRVCWHSSVVEIIEE